MKTTLKIVAVSGSILVAGIAAAAGSGSLTKDEKVLAMTARLELLETVHNAGVRRASVAGQKAVVPNLELRVTDEKGALIAEPNLPAALSNLEADLRNTDILGELRNAGLRIDGETSQAPHFTIFVVGMPAMSKSELRSRKLYLVGGIVTRVLGVGPSGRREEVGTGTYFSPPIVATGDASDAQTIRVAVRKIVNQYVREATTN